MAGVWKKTLNYLGLVEEGATMVRIGTALFGPRAT